VKFLKCVGWSEGFVENSMDPAVELFSKYSVTLRKFL
jgi:hypothetical protein